MNLPGKTIKTFVSDFESAKIGHLKEIDNIFEEVQNGLFENMMDPYWRFCQTPIICELVPVCGTEDLIKKNTKRLFDGAEKTVPLNAGVKISSSPPSNVSEKLVNLIKQMFLESVGKTKLNNSYRKLLNIEYSEKEKKEVKHREIELPFPSGWIDCGEEPLDEIEIMKIVKDSKDYEGFLQLLSSLSSVDLDSFSNDEKLAFFINIYNVLFIHILIEKSDIDDVILEKKINAKHFGYIIGDQFYTLEGIKKGILLGNKSHWLFKKPLTEKSQKKHVFDPVSWKYLLCLLSGTNRSPSFTCFQPKELQKQIDDHVKNYLIIQMKIEKKILIVPQLFQDLGLKEKPLSALLSFFIKEEFEKITYDLNDVHSTKFEYVFK